MYQPIHHSRIRLSQGHLFWRESGQGTCLVFLHGLTQNSGQWISIVDEISSDYHCFMIDLPGCGESEPLLGHPSIQAITEMLAEYFAALKVEQFYLVGHSVGGWIAANYALNHQDQVRGLILLSPEGVSTPDLKKHWQWMRSLTQSPSLSCWFLKLIRPFAGLFKKHEQIDYWLQLRQKILTQSRGNHQLLFKRRWAEYQAELLNQRLSELNIPVLVLQDVQEGAIAMAQSETYAKLISKASLDAIKPEYNLIHPSNETFGFEVSERVIQSIQAFTTQRNF
ncbi:MAG: alpha/beta fold hydrolase [Microcoleaceae cyanobacterium]